MSSFISPNVNNTIFCNQMMTIGAPLPGNKQTNEGPVYIVGDSGREVKINGHGGYYVSQHPLTFSNDYSDFEKAESWYENTYGC